MLFFTAELKSVIFAAILLIVLLEVSFAAAHTDGLPSDSNGIGIEERLGDKIPLGLIFRDEFGKPVRLTDLITAPTIILPVYYNCSNVCNFLQGGLAKALPYVKFKPGADYRVISLSFDETETPELATKYKKTYLRSMKGPFPEDGWRFLTGEHEDIIKLTDAVGYRFERKGREFVHPVVSVVVASDGTIVRYLYGTNFLAKDLSLAILEGREGRVGATVKKIVAFCFSFDPEKKSYVFNLLRVSATAVFLTAGVFLAFLTLGGKKRDKGKME
jgi:protein SCO1/2